MSAPISETAKIPADCAIGFNVVIEDNVEIGSRCDIGHGVVIHKGTRIGSGVKIDSNSVIGRQPKAGALSKCKTSEQPPAEIGDKVVIGSCVVIYANTKIESMAMIGDLSSIRERTNICKGAIVGRMNTVEPDAYIGPRAKLQCTCHITVGVILEEDVFFGTEVCTMNDKYMGTVQGVEKKGPHVKKGAAVGSNSTLLPGIVVGEKAIVGAGSVVTKDVYEGQTVVGIPAKPMNNM